MSTPTTLKQQNRGFNILFLTELWERFGFYTVASILVLYLTVGLGYSDEHAFNMFAVFTALLYITPLIGGYLADHHLGYQRTLIYGVIVLMIGYILLSIPGPFFISAGLSCVIVGNGFFKSMPYALLGKLYRHTPEKIDGKFTLYYLSINIGGIPALILAGMIAKAFGWNAAFAIAAIGLFIATLTFIGFRKVLRDIGTKKDFQTVAWHTHALIIVGTFIAVVIAAILVTHATVTDYLTFAAVLVIGCYLFIVCREFTHEEKRRVIGAVILMVLGVVFFVFYYQQPTSLALFTERNVDRHVLSFNLPASSFWIFNPIWILILGPALNVLYKKLGKHDPSITLKFGMGIVIMSLGYFIISWGTHFADANAHIHSSFIVASYLFQSLAELLVSALGTAMVVKLVPKKIIGIIMGVWFFTCALGGIIAGKLANFTAIPKDVSDPFVSLHIYQHAFLHFGVIALVIGVITCMLAPCITHLTHQKK